MRSAAILFVTLCASLFSGCGSAIVEAPESSLTCTDAAQIQVLDGMMRASCGCAESSPTPVLTNLVCTVPAGTLVQFLYLGSTNRHQILSVGTPGFVSSPPVDPETIARSHGFRVGGTGTYRFADAHHPALTGEIRVP